MNEHRPVESRSQVLTPSFGAVRVPLVTVAEAAAFERVLAQLSQQRGVISEPAADDAVSEGEGNSFSEDVERLERFDRSLRGEESGKVVDYIDLVVPVVAFVHAVLPGAGLSDQSSDRSDSQDSAGDGEDLGVDAIDPVSGASGEDPIDHEMNGFDETDNSDDRADAETRSDAVDFDHDAETSDSGDDSSDEAASDDKKESFDRALEELLRDLAASEIQMADPSITSFTAPQAALELVERLDSSTDAAGVGEVAEAMPAARGDSLDDDTPDVEDGEAEAPADAWAGEVAQAETPDRLERRAAISDQDERARESANPFDDVPSLSGPGRIQTDQSVAAADDDLLAARLSEGSHHFEMVGGTSPIRSVEVVQHANGQVTANVLVMQDYAGELSELLERVRGRLGRFKVSLLRLFVGEHMVAEIRPDQETNDESEHGA